MAGSLVPIGNRFGTQEPVTASDLIDNRVLTQHAFLPIIEQKATSKRWYHWGSGIENNDTNVGRLSADIQVADDDAGTNAAAAKGSFRFAVYPDEPGQTEPKATGDTFTLAQLRSWSADKFRQKALFPVLKPGASKDEYLTGEVKIDASQEGQMVYAEGSSVTAFMSEVKVR